METPVDGEFHVRFNSDSPCASTGRPSEYRVKAGLVYESPGGMGAASPGSYYQDDIVITNHYHKRGWRTESNDYVEWESTDRNTPYPGGGTVEPAVGRVIYQWVTYSNSQPS